MIIIFGYHQSQYMRKVNYCSFVFLLMLSIKVFAIDLQPGEIVAPVKPFNYIQTSYIFSNKDSYYIAGKKVLNGSNIDSSSMTVRYGHAFDLNQTPAFFYIQSPITKIDISGMSAFSYGDTSGKSGLGDTSLAFAIWPYVNREQKKYFGVAAYLVLPTGDYDTNRIFNIGSNRYQTALQAGYQQVLYSNINWMIALDAVFYGDNDSYLNNDKTIGTLKQDNLYTLQSGLSYDLDKNYSLAAALFHTEGGDQTFDSIDKHNPTILNRYQLTAQAKYSFGIFSLQYGQDFKTENGFKEDERLILRYTFMF